MAQRTIIEEGDGFLPEYTAVPVNKDNMLSVLRDLETQVQQIILAINGRLTFGSGLTGRRLGNFDAQVIDIVTPSTPNTEMLIPHGLGRLPQLVWPTLKDKAVDIYASSLGSWGSSVIYLKASVGDATVKLIVA